MRTVHSGIGASQTACPISQIRTLVCPQLALVEVNRSINSLPFPDEFSSQDEEEDRSVASGIENGHHHNGHSNGHSSDVVDDSGANSETTTSGTPSVIVGRCRALFNYTPKLYDELELQPGDILDIHIKQEDGWWLGALRGQVGIFPATYVEEIA